ncbi:MAG: phosphate ABC transporter substrate-binding protein [Deltaproteobacteria bacterium]|nr:phosphate ABC transporter substrate-binding protein [Deltaproteobacteria bacterium]
MKPFRTHLDVGFLRRPCLCAALSLIMLLLAGVWGCNSGASPAVRAVCVAGSTSVQPFAEKLAEIFMQQEQDFRVDVQGGGSSAGIQAAIQGAANLGASSRELIGPEKQLVEIPIAYDGIAVIVHPSNPITNLSVAQIKQIFTGQITNWQNLGQMPREIDAINREEGSGTREAFEHLVMGKSEVSPAAMVQDSNGAVREIVAGDPNAIGYISAGLVDNRVKALTIDGVAPTPENIKNHTYQLRRRFLLVSKQAPDAACKKFIDFILSPQGQQILEKEGLVGIK